MGFERIIQNVVFGSDTIEDHHTCQVNYENSRVLYFGDMPEERAEEQKEISALTEANVVEIFRLISNQISYRVIDGGLSEDELLMLDNMYACCCSYYEKTEGVQGHMLPCGLLTIESDTRFYTDLQRVGDIASGPFNLIGRHAEDSYNQKMRDLWDRFDKTVALSFDIPNVQLVYTPDDEAYNPFINHNTYSHGKLGWVRLGEIIDEQLTDHGKKEKRFLAKGIRILEECVDKAYDALEEDQYTFMVEKIEEVRNRYT